MTTRSAPKVPRAAVEYVLDVGPGATVVRDLATGRTFPHPPGDTDPFRQPSWLVLITHEEVCEHAAAERGDVGRTVRAVNRELYAAHARGYMPTLDELVETLAALERYEADRVLHLALTGGGAS